MWLQKIIKNVNRIFGSDALSEDSTEAEVTNFLENQGTMANITANEEALNTLKSQIQTINDSLSTFASVESLNNVSQKLDDFTKNNAQSMSAMKSELINAINSVKTVSAAPVTTNTEAPPVVITNKGEDNELVIKSSDLFTGQIVKGIL